MHTLSSMSFALSPIFAVAATYGNMDFLQLENINLIHLTGVLTILLLSYLLLWKPRFSSNLETPPEAAGAWPIVGHLPILSKSQPPHKTLSSMADEYGPIFSIRLGTLPTVVVSNSEVAKECFNSKNDLALSSRPPLLASKIMAYGDAMFGFTPYGLLWREMRKMTTLELLSHRQCNSLLNPVQTYEVDIGLKQLHQLWTEKKNDSGHVLVDLTKWFSELSLNTIIRIIAGKGNNDKDELQQCKEVLRQFFHYMGMILVVDTFPFLRWFDFGGHEKTMKKIAQELDKIIGGWLEEHQRKRKELGEYNCDNKDFMDAMLSLLNGREIGGYDADTMVKATCLAMFLGGTDTSTVTLIWAVSLLLNHPSILKKAQEELHAKIGHARNVKVSDCANLIYLQAIVKETLRLHPAAPLSGPRLVTEDCTIGGYHVHKGTRLFLNIWKVQTNPKVWSDPLEFRPERFLSSHKNVDVKDPNFDLLPFGGGRRICPGSTFALQMVHYTLARLLHAFKISTPDHIPVDMSETFELINTKATPLEVMLAPRLPCELYEV